ncbi:MAG: hypothetical protein Q7K41_04620, partial [Dehalococcoidales bacterium]|nr:hypothetical protein [Dehalococcoidales bacterium]
TIPPKVTSAELQALWDAGVNGVVVEITAEQPKNTGKELRRMIDQLTLPSPHREKIEPRLSPVVQEPSLETAEEEEEEE